jgi:hypothetical protein
VRNIPLFALRWESTNNNQLVNDAMSHSDDSGLSDAVENAEGWSDILLSFKGISGSVKTISNFAKTGTKAFLDAR